MELNRAIALGFFDGVHIGHQKLLNRCRELSESRGLRSTALTFDHHPDALLLKRDIKTLTTNEQRAEMLIRIGGVSEVLMLPFDEAMMNLPWTDFFHRFLLEKYHARHLIAGENFRFGHKGLGDAEKLREICTEHGIGCDIIKDVRLGGQTVSTTKIKEFLTNGDIESANSYLGHAHEIAGNVLYGRGVGSKRLVPTINMVCAPSILLPPFGVYATRVELDGQRYPAVTNIGVRPTFGTGGGVTIETNAIGYRGNAYGKQARLQLLHYLRPERKYGDADALLRQIEQDIQSAGEYFNEAGHK